MKYSTLEFNERKLPGKSGNICRTDDVANTDADHSTKVSFVPAPQPREIPAFLEHRRSQQMRAIERLATDIARLIERSDVSRSLIRGYQESLKSQPGNIQAQLDIIHERALLGTWEFKLSIARDRIKAIAQRVAS